MPTVAYNLKQEDGKITNFTITTNDIASATELEALKELVGMPSTPEGEPAPTQKPTGIFSQIKNYSLHKLNDEQFTQAQFESNVQEAYQLVDNDNLVCGDYIKVYKDSSLQNVELTNTEVVTSDGISTMHQALKFTYLLADGNTKVVDLDVSTFLTQAEFKNGLEVNTAGEVSVKIDPTSDNYLTVSENGVKLSGVDNAITNITNEMAKISGTYSVDDIAFEPINGDVYNLQATIDEAKYQDIYEAVQDNKIITYNGIIFSTQIVDDTIKSTYFSTSHTGVLGTNEMRMEFNKGMATLQIIVTPWIAENVGFDPDVVNALNPALQSESVQGIIEELASELNDSSFIINKTDLGSTTLYGNLFNAIKDNKLILFKNNDNLINVSCNISETDIWVSVLIPYANELHDLNLFSNLIVLHEDGTYDIEEASIDLLVSGEGTKYLNDKGEYAIVKSSETTLADNTTHITLASSTDENGVITYSLGESDIASKSEVDEDILVLTKASADLNDRIDNLLVSTNNSIKITPTYVEDTTQVESYDLSIGNIDNQLANKADATHTHQANEVSLANAKSIDERFSSDTVSLQQAITEIVTKMLGNVRLWKITQEEYNTLKLNGALDANTVYVIDGIGNDNILDAASN